MTPLIDIFVPGTCVPQGSLRASRHGHLYYSNSAKLKPWREAMSSAIRDALPEDHEPIDEGVRVEALFYFERPKSVTHPQKRSAPDADKLFRAVGDALTESKLFTDDSRIIDLRSAKQYTDDEHAVAGVRIKVWVL